MEYQKSRKQDPLDLIDGCTDGTECPDAAWCREYTPHTCPLCNDQFEMEPETPLDEVLKLFGG